MLKGLLIGAGIGFVLGALGDGFFTGVGLAVVFGFVGWLIGLIVTVSKSGSKAAAPTQTGLPTPGMPRVSDARIAALENRVAVLEARIAKMAGETVAPSFVPDIAEQAAETVAAEAPPPIPAQEPVAVEVPEVAAEPPPPPPPREPPKPNPIVAWFTGGNTIVRVGIVVLFIGLAFLARYSIEHGLVPPELRVAGIGLVGIVLLGLGFRLAKSRPGYGLSLQGAGVGILYLTVFGALRLYTLIPAEAAFPLLVVIAALATWLAIKQDSAVLAGFGAAGGFLAPVLASSGRGDHVMLFGYFTVLNLAILGTAWFKSWRSLNLVGFVFTFVIGALWGAKSYRPENFATVEPFLVLFCVMYVVVAILFARRETTVAGRRVDGTLVFGVPLVGFGLQSALVKDTELGLALSAVVLAAFYLSLAWAFHKRAGEGYRLLVRAFLALGVVFVTVAIPLAFDSRWTSAAWAVEGAAVLWMGARQGRWVPQAFGTLVQLAGGASFVLALISSTIPQDMFVLNGVFLGYVMIAGAGLFSHWALRTSPPSKVTVLSSPYFIWALMWWVSGLIVEFEHFLGGRASYNLLVAALAATALAFSFGYRNGAWREAAWPTKALLPAMWVVFLFSVIDIHWHPFADWGWLAWPFALSANMLALRRVETTDEAGGTYRAFLHAGTMVLATVILSIELRHDVQGARLGHTAWSAAVVMVVMCFFVSSVCTKKFAEGWPGATNLIAYRKGGVTTIAIGILAWIVLVNTQAPRSSEPLPYLPLLNAVDLAHGLILFTVIHWWTTMDREWPPRRVMPALLGIVAFLWVNAILLRTLYFWADVPYNLDSWMRSFITQASLSIFWSVLALGLMVWATRKARRELWMVGAALMAVVVVKLVIIDLARLGGLERIVSFIGVGILMLVIGYFSPVPPRRS